MITKSLLWRNSGFECRILISARVPIRSSGLKTILRGSSALRSHRLWNLIKLLIAVTGILSMFSLSSSPVIRMYPPGTSRPDASPPDSSPSVVSFRIVDLISCICAIVSHCTFRELRKETAPSIDAQDQLGALYEDTSVMSPVACQSSPRYMSFSHSPSTYLSFNNSINTLAMPEMAGSLSVSKVNFLVEYSVTNTAHWT
jgi:hypothetical protein